MPESALWCLPSEAQLLSSFHDVVRTNLMTSNAATRRSGMEIPVIVLAKIVFRRPGLHLRVGKGSTTIPKAGHVKRSTRKPRNAL